MKTARDILKRVVSLFLLGGIIFRFNEMKAVYIDFYTGFSTEAIIWVLFSVLVVGIFIGANCKTIEMRYKRWKAERLSAREARRAEREERRNAQ